MGPKSILNCWLKAVVATRGEAVVSSIRRYADLSSQVLNLLHLAECKNFPLLLPDG